MPSAQRTFRLKTVSEITTLHRATVHRKVSEGTFPKPMIIGKRTPVWHESDIVDYQNKLREKAGLPALEELEQADRDEAGRSRPVPRQAAHPAS